MALQSIKDCRVGIAELEHHLALARHDVRRARPQDDAADIPDRVRPSQARELLRDLRRQAQQSSARIFTARHRGCSRVVGLAAGSDAESTNTHQPRDNADAAMRLFETRSLLDMRLQITKVPRRIDATRTCRAGNGGQRRAQTELATLGRVDLGLRQIIAKSPAPQEGEKGTLFILEGYDVDTDR